MNAKLNLSIDASLIKSSAIIIALGLSGGMAFAAENAYDTSANYTGGWSDTTSPNLGSGFGAWNIEDNNDGSPIMAGTFLDLASNGNPDTVLTGGSSWGVYAFGMYSSISLTRPFNTGGGSASLVNQTFSFAFNTSGISSGSFGQYIDFYIGDAFNLGYTGSSGATFLNIGGQSGFQLPVSLAQLAAGVNVALTVTGPANSTTEGFVFSITPFAGGPAIYTDSGTFNSSVYSTSSFAFDDNDAANNQYFNNLSITPTPEPSVPALLGMSALAAMVALRRRK